MARLGGKKTISILINSLEQLSCNFHIERIDNPTLLNIEDRVFTVFLKPIGDVCYDNPNESTRVQLPYHTDFDKIKLSKRPFLLMGYDLANSVFTIWNPASTKRRLNTKKNLSFYSRLSAQREASKKGKIVRCELTNGDYVWVVPKDYFSFFLMQIENYFPQIKEEDFIINEGDSLAINESNQLFSIDQNDILDEDGKIVAIKNPTVLNELKQARLSGEPFAEYHVLYKHYADKTYLMKLTDWAHLLDAINEP